jgi:hypothetical protein
MKLNTIIRRYVIVMMCFCASANCNEPLQKGEVDEDAQQIIAQMLDALGGKQAINDLRSLAVTAACSGPGGAFRTEVDSFRPGLVRFRQSSDQNSGDGANEIWSNPDRTWSLDSEGRAKEHAPGVRQFVRSHEFHFEIMEVLERFSGHRMGKTANLRDQACTTVLMEDHAGQNASLCISNETRLPVMLEVNPEGAAGPVRVWFENWQWHDDLRYFHAFDLTEGPDRSFRYDYDSIRPNGASALRFVSPPDPAQRADHNALLSVLEQGRQAHLETDAALLAGDLADQLISVSNGGIYHQTRAEVQAFFTRVFEGANYQIWEDTEPPQIRISGDGNNAWVARRVQVRRSSPASDGTLLESDFVSAYTSTYEKFDGAWKMTSVTSTFLPENAN